MVNRRQLLLRLACGHLHNVPFADFITLVEGFGFRLLRHKGSHHLFGHPQLSELLNLQEVKGQAKPYQIRQFLRLIEKYNIQLEEE